jgi:hypothetical protein
MFLGPLRVLLGDPTEDPGHREKRRLKAGFRVRRIGFHFDFRIGVIHGFSSFQTKLNQSTAVRFAF